MQVIFDPKEAKMRAILAEMNRKGIVNRRGFSLAENIGLIPDGFSVHFTFEWPNTPEDYAFLLSLPNQQLEWIQTNTKEWGNRKVTVGIDLKLKGSNLPLIYGEGSNMMWRANFDNTNAKTVVLSEMKADKFGSFR
jgi:hypothetical protein